MPLGRLLVAPLLALMFLPTLARADADTPPTLVLRLQSLDRITSDLVRIATSVGEADKAKQAEGLIKAFLGESGLDRSRPIALYGSVTATGVDSTIVLVLPVTGEKEFIEQIARFNVKAEKGEDDVYALQVAVGVPVPVFLRFHDKHAYVTVQDRAAIAKKAARPAASLMPKADDGLISLSLRLDSIPDALKQIALGQVDLKLADAKEQGKPGESAVEARLRQLILDGLTENLKRLLTDGRELTVSADFSDQVGGLRLRMVLTGKPGSKLAEDVANLGKQASALGGLLGPSLGMAANVRLALPESTRQQLVPVIEAMLKESLAKTEATKRPQAEKLLSALAPSLKAGELEGAVAFHGPTANGDVTMVAGIKLHEGTALEKAVKDVIGTLKEADRGKLELDADSAGAVKLHRLKKVLAAANAKTQALLGADSDGYLAITEDRLLLTVGPDAAGVMKAAVAAPAKPAPVAKFSILSGLLGQMIDRPGAADLMARAFGPGGEKKSALSLTVTGGPALTMELDIAEAILKFVAQSRTKE